MADEVVLSFRERGLKRAEEFARASLKALRQSRTLSKEVKRELVEGVRAGIERIKILREAARAEEQRRANLQSRADALRAGPETDLGGIGQAGRIGRRALGIGNRLTGIAGAASAAQSLTGALSLGANLAGAIPGIGPAVALAVTAIALPLVERYRAEARIAIQDVAARTEALGSQLQTFGERLQDPTFLAIQSRQAHRELLEEESRLGDRGWSEATRGVLGDE